LLSGASVQLFGSIRFFNTWMAWLEAEQHCEAVAEDPKTA
jgi:hypothetical protein